MTKNFTKSILNSALFLASLGFANAQSPQLFKDLTMGEEPINATSTAKAGTYPENMTVANGIMWFSGRDRRTDSPTNGHLLYKSDGTQDGTVFVKVLQSPVTVYGNLTSGFTGVPNGTVFFNHRIQGSYNSLWKTNGTEEGTVRLKQFFNTSNGADMPQGFVTIGDTVYFTANNGNGIELWKSDGTTEGTVEVVDLSAGSGGGLAKGGDPGRLIAFKNKVYFAGTTSTYDLELYSSDGTAAGTKMVRNIKALGSSEPKNFIVFNNELFFQADGTMWKTDGTSEGTVQVINQAFSNPVLFKDKLYFNGNGSPASVWVSNGSAVGTTLVSSVAGNIVGGNSAHLYTNATTYAYPPPTYQPVVTLAFYKLDGTTTGITKIAYNVGTTASFNRIGEKMYIARLDSGTTSGFNLWETDGTLEGTKKLPIRTTPYIYKNKLFYQFYETVAGNELYYYDPEVVTNNVVAQKIIQLNVFPNPAEDRLFLNLSGNEVTADIVSLEGLFVKTVTLTSNASEINIEELPKGVYLLKIKTSGGSAVHKFIKQ